MSLDLWVLLRSLRSRGYRRMGHNWPAAMLVAIMVPTSAAHAREAASVTTHAGATIDAPISIVANQDVILGAILLRAASVNTGNPVDMRGHVGFMKNDDPTQALFLIAGQADQEVSVAIPFRIALTSLAGKKGLSAETLLSVLGRSGSQLSQSALNNHGLLLFSVRSRLVLGTEAITGDYRGLLVATAQYN